MSDIENNYLYCEICDDKVDLDESVDISGHESCIEKARADLRVLKKISYDISRYNFSYETLELHTLKLLIEDKIKKYKKIGVIQ